VRGQHQGLDEAQAYLPVPHQAVVHLFRRELRDALLDYTARPSLEATLFLVAEEFLEFLEVARHNALVNHVVLVGGARFRPRLHHNTHFDKFRLQHLENLEAEDSVVRVARAAVNVDVGVQHVVADLAAERLGVQAVVHVRVVGLGEALFPKLPQLRHAPLEALAVLSPSSLSARRRGPRASASYCSIRSECRSCGRCSRAG